MAEKEDTSGKSEARVQSVKLTSEDLQKQVDVAQAHINVARFKLEASKVPEAAKILEEMKSPGGNKKYFDVAKAAQDEMDQNPRLWEAMKGMQEAGFGMPLRDPQVQPITTVSKGKLGR